jgi:hypothetical protein
MFSGCLAQTFLTEKWFLHPLSSEFCLDCYSICGFKDSNTSSNIDHVHNVGFKVVKVMMNFKMAVCWDVTSCSLVGTDRRFWEVYSSRRWNIGQYLPEYTEYHPGNNHLNLHNIYSETCFGGITTNIEPKLDILLSVADQAILGNPSNRTATSITQIMTITWTFLLWRLNIMAPQGKDSSRNCVCIYVQEG